MIDIFLDPEACRLTGVARTHGCFLAMPLAWEADASPRLKVTGANLCAKLQVVERRGVEQKSR